MWSSRDRAEQAERAARGDGDEVIRPSEPRGSRGVVGQTLGASIPIRNRQRAAEEAEQDHATPEQRAFQGTARVIDLWANHHLELNGWMRNESASS